MPICLKFAAPGPLGEVMKVTGMTLVLTVPAPCGASDWFTQIANPGAGGPPIARPPGLTSTPVVVMLPRAIVCVTVRSLKDAHGAEPGMVAVTPGTTPPVAYTSTNWQTLK